MRLPLPGSVTVTLTFVIAFLTACGDDPYAPPLRDGDGRDGTGAGRPPQVACSDADGDGFGTGCTKGADCDDRDPAVTDGCYRCTDNAPGCPCPYEGQRIACGKVTISLPDLGKVVCGDGGQVCTDGVWSACLLGAYAPGHDGARPPGNGK